MFPIRLIYSRNWPRVAQALVCVTLAGYAGCVALAAQALSQIEDPFVRYAVAFVIVQFTILAILGLSLIAGKHVRVRWEWLRNLRIRRLEELLAKPDSDDAVLVASRKWPREFLTVVERAILSLKGSMRQRMVGLLEASAIYRNLLAQTTDRNPSRAVRAITLLGQLGTAEAEAAIKRGLEHRDEPVRQAARKAIMQGHDQAAQRTLLNGFPALPPWQRLIMFHYAPADSELLREFIADALHSDNEPRTLVALELVLTQQRLLLAPVPAALARAANPEIRIKLFKALPFLNLEGDVIRVLQLGLEDTDWRVRAMAARTCGHFRPAVLAERLLKMCRSFEKPAEAGHATRALAAMGGEGWLRLQEMANSETGQARHIATEAVERHRLGGVA